MSLRHCALVAIVVAVPIRASGQAPTVDSSHAPARAVSPLVLVGSLPDDLRRLRQLTADDNTAGTMIRTTSALTSPAFVPWQLIGYSMLAPAIEYTYNSTLPSSANDGSVWAGRGSSMRIAGGIAVAAGRVRVHFAPELSATQNRDVAIIPSPDPGRSAFASPWLIDLYSADVPARFGVQPVYMVTLGQSMVEVRGGPVAGGFSTEDQWWGPGMRNALVLSNNAPGIPHVFLRTPEPLRFGFGEFEARWILGWLTESIFFDRLAANDLRSLSGIVATFRPAPEPGLTVGASRVVYAPISKVSSAFGHFADAVVRWDQTSRADVAPADGASEQIFSLFGRWVFPASGVEVYGEWARHHVPSSFRELFVSPQRSQAFTVGMQVAKPAGGGTVRGRIELTTLEQTGSRSYYVSPFITQGYTNRGQVLGAAIGPGSSSQDLGIDYLRSRWQLGGRLGRIRWNEDAYRRQSTGFARHAHDVSLDAGVRGALRFADVLVEAELDRTQRLNYLFQNRFGGATDDRTYDTNNTTLRLSASYAP